MKRWKVISAVALIFASGIVTGALALRTANSRTLPPRERPGPGGFIEARFQALKNLEQELNLSPQQTQRIDAILDDGCKRMHNVWDSCQPQMHDEMKKVHERIQAELDPSQLAKYDELMRRARERRSTKHPEGENRGSTMPRSNRAEPPVAAPSEPPR